MDITEKANRLQMQLIKNDTFASFDTEILTFKTQTYVFLFYHFIKQQMTRMWQKFFESKLPIPEPHIYQCHFFLKKKNRREKSLNRAIVMSDKVIIIAIYLFLLMSSLYLIQNTLLHFLMSIRLYLLY